MSGSWRQFAVLSICVVGLAVSPGAPAHAVPLDGRLQKAIDGASSGTAIPVIVAFHGEADFASIPQGPRQARRAELLRALRSRAETAQRSARAFLRGYDVDQVKELWINNSLAVTASPAIIRELAARPEVASVRLEEVVRLPPALPAQTASAVELNVRLINAPALWAMGIAGQGVTVASMDSGVDIDHPDLGPRWRGGSNSWFDPNGQHPLVPFDNDGHGTGVMGILVGGDAGGTAIGVAPEAQWIAVKIFDDSGEASESAIHQGFQWLLDPDGNPLTDDAPDVVNNSWGFEDAPGICTVLYQVFRPDVQALKAAGIAVVFSAGNTGPAADTSVSPANYPESFAVGVVGSFRSATEIAEISARGPSACDGTIYPEVVAPGFFVKTADLTLFPDPYAFVTGSSIAAPHAAGAMALLLSAHPALSVAELEQAIVAGAADLGLAGPDNDYGYGLVDALAALDQLNVQDLSNTPPPPALLQTPVDGSTSLPTTVTLTWSQPPDADGDAVLNTVQVATNPHFLYPLVVSSSSGSIPGLLLGFAGLAVGLFPLGRVKTRRWQVLIPLLMIGLGLLALVSCGGGGGGGGDSDSDDDSSLRSQVITGLDPAATYYWRVVSQDDRGGTSISGVFSFLTAP